MSRTIRTRVYKFNELSEQAKKVAIENYRSQDGNNSHYFDEITDSVKAVGELFDLKFGRSYSDVRTGHIADDLLNLSGIRLYKYLMNNYYSFLFTPKYIKLFHSVKNWKPFICRVKKSHKGDSYTQVYSKNFVNNDCPLTGVCYDNDILQPVYDFLKKPDKSTTYDDLLEEIESAIESTYRSTEKWLNSDEFIKDEIQANDYEFTKDGKLFHS